MQATITRDAASLLLQGLQQQCIGDSAVQAMQSPLTCKAAPGLHSHEQLTSLMHRTIAEYYTGYTYACGKRNLLVTVVLPSVQAPEDDDPTAHIVQGPSSSLPPSVRPSPTSSQIELSKVRLLWWVENTGLSAC